MVVHDGMKCVPATHEYMFESPFYFDGITFDEYFIEQSYLGYCIANKKMIGYKTLRKQLEDGDIDIIPDEFKISCLFPDNCTAYNDLIPTAKAG